MRSTKRGLSDEKVCVPTAVNLEGKSTGVVCNLGKPTTANLKTALGCKILPGSTLVTDSLGDYPSLAESCKAKHVQIPSKKHKKGIFNIQLNNYYHSALKAMTNIRFRGVATKYLNNYIVYNNFVTFAKESFMEKIKILKNEIFTIGVEERSFSVNISKRDPLPLLKDQYLL
jgi:putative transposase